MLGFDHKCANRTLIGLPLTVGAIVRALWLRYRITNRRGDDLVARSHRHYLPEIVKIVKVPRGIGFWGDMLTLRDAVRSRLELQFLSFATFITILMRK